MSENKAWRVNVSPRLSAAEFGEYMAADDGPRETILRDAKFERLARSLGYRTVLDAASRHLASPIRDRKILAECRDRLEAEKVAAADPTRRNNVVHQLEALDRFEAALNALGVAGLEAQLVSNQNTGLAIEGVNISVWPTVWLRRNSVRGPVRVGALLVDFAKGVPLKTETARAKAVNSMEHVACLLHMKTDRDYRVEGERAANDMCLVHHLARGDQVCAPQSYAKKVRNMEAVCRSIALAWDAISPPASFDPEDAYSRS